MERQDEKNKIKQNPYNSNFKFRFEHFSLSWYKVHFFKKMNIVLNRHNHPVLLIITRRKKWHPPWNFKKKNPVILEQKQIETTDRSIIRLPGFSSKALTTPPDCLFVCQQSPKTYDCHSICNFYYNFFLGQNFTK